MGDLEELALRTLADLLTEQEIASTPIARGLAIDGSSGAIRLGDLHIIKHDRPGWWIAYVPIEFALNSERPDTSAMDHGVAMGRSPEEAVVAAVQTWFAVDCPALLSVLTYSSRMGASWIHDETELGLPGWHLCVGPQRFMHAPADKQALRDFLEAGSLLERTSDVLANELDPRRINFVKLFWGKAGPAAEPNAECLINGTDSVAVKERLLSLPWPPVSDHTMVWLFLVLLPTRPNAG